MLFTKQDAYKIAEFCMKPKEEGSPEHLAQLLIEVLVLLPEQQEYTADEIKELVLEYITINRMRDLVPDED